MTAPICPRCGKEMVEACPEPGCHGPIETYSRPCGYLRPVSTWNDGKQQEFCDRAEYALDRKAEQMKGDHADER